jgi:putative transposase
MNPLNKSTVMLFQGRHFNAEIITLCVRWYVTYKLSYRDLVSIMAECNVDVAHTTILRWVQRYVPEFAKRWQRFARSMGTSWRVEETSITRKGKWVSLYRGVDTEGQTIDFFLREPRDSAAAKRCLPQAIEKRDLPPKLTRDGYAASPVAVGERQKEGTLPAPLRVRTTRSLHNGIAQDLRPGKQRGRPRLGFTGFAPAVSTISGLE